MSMFSSIDIAGSGLDVDQTWINTISGNVANADDVTTPGGKVYQEQEVEAEASPNAPGVDGSGVQVEQVLTTSGQGILASDPTSPLANKAGLVEYPNVDIGNQMTALVEAQSDYEANANVLGQSESAYKAILDIKA